MTLMHSHFICLLMILFSWEFLCFINFECRWSCDFHVFMDSFMFYSLLKGLRTSLQNYHKTSYVILHFERVFNWYHEICLIYLECQFCIKCMLHEIYDLVSYFEEYITSYFKNYPKLVHILLLVEFSNYTQIFFKFFFLKTPTNRRADGWATMPCMLILNIFYHVHE